MSRSATKRRSQKRRRSRFAQLSPAYKAVLGLIAPVCTILATLLALNVIHPFGEEDALASGVRKTSEAATAAVTVHFSAGGQHPRQFDADGVFDYRTGWARFDYEFGDEPRVEARMHRGDIYIRLPRAGARPWVHANLADAREQLEDYAAAAGLPAPPADLSSLTDVDFTDPSQVLEQLRRATAVKSLGPDRVFGVAVRGYEAVIPPRRAADPRLAITAMIDGDELIRRLDIAATGGAMPFTATMTFTDFGRRVSVEAPRPGLVRELQDVLDQLLASAGSSTPSSSHA
jgi:hypothetical protein